MRPLTARLPKPLLPAGGAPFLEHQLRALAEAGVTHVAVLVGYRMREVHEALGDGGRSANRSWLASAQPIRRKYCACT